MKLDEAVRIVTEAPGTFEQVSAPEGRARIKYTGTDPEDEGRVAQAIAYIADELGLGILGFTTDDVYLSSTASQTAGEEER